jgi:hypothetical protein
MVLAKSRELECLALRKAGATYDQIAEKTGLAREGARLAVSRALKSLAEATTEAAEEVRQLELDRLDAMLLGLWQKAQRGDPQAIDRVLRIQERRAKYLGIDAPASSALDNVNDGDTDVVDWVPKAPTPVDNG